MKYLFDIIGIIKFAFNVFCIFFILFVVCKLFYIRLAGECVEVVHFDTLDNPILGAKGSYCNKWEVE